MDYEPYFERWNSVLFYPRPGVPEHAHLLAGHSGDIGSIPCHQHKSCEGLIRATTPYPPRVCVHCGVDTLKEQQEIEQQSEEGVILRGFGST